MRWSPEAREERTDRQLSAVAAAVARSVRSGSPLLDALRDAAVGVALPGTRLAEDLDGLARAVRHGRALDDVLADWARRDGDRSVELFVAACRFGHAEGGDLAAALDGAAVSLLDHVEVADEARALASQARSSAVALAALPVLGAAGFSVLDPEVARTLFTTPPGLLCLLLGAALELAGAMVLARMVRRATA